MAGGDAHRGPEGFAPTWPAPDVVVWQPVRGQRASADAFWLAGLTAEVAGEAGPAPQIDVVDLGTGCGIVAALLAGRGLSAVGVDVMAAWEAAWAVTARPGLSFLRCDLRVADPPVRGRIVALNPPYFRPSQGHVPADPLRASARHALHGELPELLAASRAWAVEDDAARVVAVLPRAREADAREAMAPWRAVAGYDVGRVRSLRVYARQGAEAAPVRIPDDGERVAKWYAAVSARPARGAGATMRGDGGIG